MDYASPVELVKLLLRQCDRHPIRAIGGEELLPFDPAFAVALGNLGILKRRRNLRDDGETALLLVGKELVALDRVTGDCERSDGALDIRLYDIDFGAICHQLREQSDLVGPRPSQLSSRVWRLGRLVRNGRGAEICLVRRLREDTLQQVLDHVRGAFPADDFVAVIGLARCDLPTPMTRQLLAMRISVTMVEDHLGAAGAKPFALDLRRVRLPSSAPADEARLIVDNFGRRCTFDGIELAVEPRDFGVLVLLAEEAADSRGWVHKETISATITGATGHDGNPEQADRSINRLRDTFRKDARIRDAPANGFIETKSKVGYRLTLSSIGFIK